MTAASLYGDEFIMPSCESRRNADAKSTLLPPPKEDILNLNAGGTDFQRHAPLTFDWWVDMTVSFWCMVISGIMSGLTVGLASIDRLSLEIASR
jgi:hypothetical protein